MCLKAELAFVKIDAIDSRDCVPGLRGLQWSSALAYNWWVRKIYAGLIVSRKESNRDLLVSVVHSNKTHCISEVSQSYLKNLVRTL